MAQISIRKFIFCSGVFAFSPDTSVETRFENRSEEPEKGAV